MCLTSLIGYLLTMKGLNQMYHIVIPSGLSVLERGKYALALLTGLTVPQIKEIVDQDTPPHYANRAGLPNPLPYRQALREINSAYADLQDRVTQTERITLTNKGRETLTNGNHK